MEPLNKSAIHEAGHCIVAHGVGFEVRGLYLASAPWPPPWQTEAEAEGVGDEWKDYDPQGHCYTYFPPALRVPTEIFGVQQIANLLGGHLADLIMFGSSATDNSYDLFCCKRTASEMAEDLGGDADTYLKKGEGVARVILRRDLYLLRKVAKALAERGQLDQAEIAALLGEVTEPPTGGDEAA